MANAIRVERIQNLTPKEPKLVPKPESRGKLGEILTFIANFAFESTVNPYPKISTGRKQVHKVQQEELKEQPFPLPFNNKNKSRDLKLVMEKMQEDINKIKQQHTANCMALKKISDENLLAEMEKIQEDMNDVKRQQKVLAKCVEESESTKKKPEEDMKGWDLLQKNRKRVFIRSRL